MNELRSDGKPKETCLVLQSYRLPLARLLWLQHELQQGYDCVVWLDADFLIFEPQSFCLPPDSYALGREVWIDQVQGKLKAWKKVHNAFLMFRQNNPFLSFYIHAAERLISSHRGAMVPQLAGPKFRTGIHNMIRCPVLKSAAVFSPLVIKDLLAGKGLEGDGVALSLLKKRSNQLPKGANLCASSVARDELTHEELSEAVKHLLTPTC